MLKFSRYPLQKIHLDGKIPKNYNLEQEKFYKIQRAKNPHWLKFQLRGFFARQKDLPDIIGISFKQFSHKHNREHKVIANKHLHYFRIKV